MRWTFSLFLWAGLTLSLGCGRGGGEDNPDLEGCEHLENGPLVEIDAAEEASSAPAVDADHMRYDIALPEGEGGAYEGYVSFAPGEAADFVFFLGQDVDFAVENSSGEAVSIEESESSSPACELIRGRHVVELEVATYGLRFGPTSEGLVQLVIEEEGHEEHEEHEEHEHEG